MKCLGCGADMSTVNPAPHPDFCYCIDCIVSIHHLLAEGRIAELCPATEAMATAVGFNAENAAEAKMLEAADSLDAAISKLETSGWYDGKIVRRRRQGKLT